MLTWYGWNSKKLGPKNINIWPRLFSSNCFDPTRSFFNPKIGQDDSDSFSMIMIFSVTLCHFGAKIGGFFCILGSSIPYCPHYNAIYHAWLLLKYATAISGKLWKPILLQPLWLYNWRMSVELTLIDNEISTKIPLKVFLSSVFRSKKRAYKYKKYHIEFNSFSKLSYRPTQWLTIQLKLKRCLLTFSCVLLFDSVLSSVLLLCPKLDKI